MGQQSLQILGEQVSPVVNIVGEFYGGRSLEGREGRQASEVFLLQTGRLLLPFVFGCNSPAA
jgi:hypothetical protein